jgi:hypothetical protein
MMSLGLWHAIIWPILGYFRRRRGQFILTQFPDIRSLTVCDVGGSEHFWDKLDINMPRQNITIYNTSTDETKPVADREDRCSVIVYDGRRLPVEDKAFDLCICNSVIEHVPPSARLAFVKEILRVAPRVFVQTPAFEFFFEPHFLVPGLHWLPRRLAYALVWVSPWRLLGRPSHETIKRYFSETYLLKEEEFRALFPDCRILPENVFGLVKAHYAVRQKATP